MEKTVVCFANSRKPGGRCFAGKSIDDKRWIRPVSSRETHSLTEREECIKNSNCDCDYCSPEVPNLMDILKIELICNDCQNHQTENFSIGEKKWEKVGHLSKSSIDEYLDKNFDSLWINGYSSYNRLNDRFPVDYLGNITDSLRLIEVDGLVINVVEETYLDGNRRKRVYGKFKYGNENYILPVTDNRFEDCFMEKQPGTVQKSNDDQKVILCISLAPEFKGSCYKLIAGIILFKRN